MKGKAGCPQCGGTGFILDPDPRVPARSCTCVQALELDAGQMGIPPRYRTASFETFWEWWKAQHPRTGILDLVQGAEDLLALPEAQGGPAADLRGMLEHILSKGQSQSSIKPAQEPSGFSNLRAWATHGRPAADLWWLDGQPGSGRSSLAAAALRAWSHRTGLEGRFASVRALSQELKDTYYDVRSFQNQDFQSERDRMAPFLEARCLVLDDLDRLDPDPRVARAVAQLLDHRYAQELPTILVASRWVEALMGQEGFALSRIEDASLLQRLARAQRVELRPTLERIMSRLDGR
ncbi:MAG: hypothetical protein HY823_07755 [Acidobacteria bacterium]|nr:hypothetical protein [Acidobacteriota bacterium]